MRKAEDIIKDGKNTRFSSENQPENNGRKKGVPLTATRLARFLNATTKGKHPTTGEEGEFTVAELMDLQQIKKALNGDTSAWEKILDRLEGKSKNPVEFSGVDGEPIQVEQTLIQIAFRQPSDEHPNASKKPTAPKGERKKG